MWSKGTQVAAGIIGFSKDAFASHIPHWRSMPICHIIDSAFIAAIQQCLFELSIGDPDNVLP